MCRLSLGRYCRAKSTKMRYRSRLRKPCAMAIDIVIASPLFGLSPAHVHHVVKANPPPLPAELPVRTLVRGAAIRLPTGETVAANFGRGPLRGAVPPGYASDPWADLDALGLTGRTPLWYYVLLEAELEQRGGKLGTVGSRLVAETIEGALRADPESFLRVNGPARCSIFATSCAESISMPGM